MQDYSTENETPLKLPQVKVTRRFDDLSPLRTDLSPLRSLPTKTVRGRNFEEQLVQENQQLYNKNIDQRAEIWDQEKVIDHKEQEIDSLCRKTL
jgi:hypothetical protein